MADRRKTLTEGPRERRKEDRRKEDEKTSHVRRKLSDRRTTYNTKPAGGTIDAIYSYSNKLGQNVSELKEVEDIFDREDREAVRRLGSRKEVFDAMLSKEPFITKIRPKIKSRKGGLLGLGMAVGNALAAGKEAYDKSKETY